jgi:very-short-patch-repair endonuclease
MRREPTPAERRLWTWLRDRRFSGYKFHRQYPIAGFILDFYCPELKLAIELDGKHHGTADMSAYDSARTIKLRALGLEILRLPNEVFNHISVLAEECIRVAITNASSKA